LLQKTLSIPATVSGVVKYIPELQQQVEGLIQKKEELLSRISRQEAQTHQENSRQLPARSSSSAVSASWLNDREVMIQISTYTSPLSEILLTLEEDGFLLLNASSFESFGEKVFYNLHLQVCFVSLVNLLGLFVFFFFFFYMSAQEGEGGFELVTSALLGVIPAD
jgi:hypothetical protein